MAHDFVHRGESRLLTGLVRCVGSPWSRRCGSGARERAIRVWMDGSLSAPRGSVAYDQGCQDMKVGWVDDPPGAAARPLGQCAWVLTGDRNSGEIDSLKRD